VCFVDAERRPVIGISDMHKDGTNAAVPRSYVDAVLLTGGIPVVVPLMTDDEKIIELLNSLDGIIFTGGEDFDPVYYNERPIPQMGKINAPRDKFDMKLLRLAAERGIPVLGICRGIQLINIAYGGSLYQDLSAQYYDNSVRHRQKQLKEEASHSVIVEDHTVFADIVRDRMLMVNSSHHQAIKDVAKGFRVAGKSTDKIVEVIEKIDDENWILGVQFHPEVRVTRDNAMRRIFQRFIDEAGSQEKPDRKIKTASVSRIQTEYETPKETPVKRESAPAPTPQIVYKSVTDTQFIYKFVRDTQFIYTQADTVYISVPDKQVVYVRDTVYISTSDTIYVSVPETKVPVTKTPKSVPPTDTSKPETVKSAAPDTLIYTPGTPITAPVVEKKKNEEKKDARREKREAEEKEKQYRKELLEKAKQKKRELKEKELQKKKEQKELEEKEKFAKKEAIEKEKQFQREQKENAKLDKKELKEQEKQDKEEPKKPEQK
jgi:gamma-glutamyl-gamma-aminobutyrate hydrolase PuuD